MLGWSHQLALGTQGPIAEELCPGHRRPSFVQGHRVCSGFVGKVPGWNRLAQRTEWGCQALTPPERGQGAGTRLGCAEILLNSEFSLLSELPCCGKNPTHSPVWSGGNCPRLSRGWRLWKGVWYKIMSLNLVTEAP